MLPINNGPTTVSKITKVFLLTLLLVILGSCATTKKFGSSSANDLWELSTLTPEESKMAHDLLAYGLEHEALYTLLDTLKPMSSMGFPLSYPLGKVDGMKDGDKAVVSLSSDSTKLALEALEKWNNVLGALSNDQLEFTLIPFNRTWKGKRNLQILVCNKAVLNKLLNEKAAFFGQWGFVSNSDPATILTAIEFESRNDRYRAYGYLFGYPEHAVDFFVEASIAEEETGEFVKRDFFSMPVAVGQRGYFTYAIPKDYAPDQRDSAIYDRASATLSRYQLVKKKYSDSKGKVDALKLISDYWNNSTNHR